jgi:16S rRNA (cytosine1402-N4)-methyltransferase
MRSPAVSRSARWTAQTPPAPVSLVGEKSRQQPLPGGLQVSASNRVMDNNTMSNDEVFRHDPVMIDEIIEGLSPVPAGTIVDCTLGGAGHAARLLEALPECRYVGIDQDPMALSVASARLARFGDRFQGVHGRFDSLASIMTDLQISDVSAVFFDLGVSSPQLDLAERGFSYRNDGPVDMRMDPTRSWSAADVVNGYSEDELAEVLRVNGDERFAGRIARAIVANRPIESTVQLASVVRDAIPAAARRRGGHPAKRTFQAIRIEVNDELAILPIAVDAAIEVTRPAGRVAVLSYHSGEDRIVKDRFRYAATGGCTCPADLPCVCDAVQTVRLVRPEKRKPSAAETERNPRSESAILRMVERLPYPITVGE